MKSLLALSVSLALCGVALAQEQEQKLVDRLLRPKVELKNSEQNKQFYGTGTATIDKKANTKSFYVSEKTEPRTFVEKREFATREHMAASFAGGNKADDQDGRAASTATFTGPKKAATTSARDSGRGVPARDYYAGNRTFNEKGKSQKSLDRKNAPMTIDQVRELLNKNR